MEGNIRQRLYDIETPPPPGAWQNIARALDAEDEQRTAPVVPINTETVPVRRINLRRLALAASIVGFVAMTALWLVERNRKPAAAEPVIASGERSSTTTKAAAPDTVQVQKLIRDTVFVTTPGETVILTQPPVILPPQRDNRPVITDPSNDRFANNRSNSNNNRDVQGADPNSNKNNSLVADPSARLRNNDVAISNTLARDSNGKVIQDIGVVNAGAQPNIAGPSRGDKSIANILSRISVKGDNEELDRLIEESPYWKKKIQEWRDKLIKSGYTPSLINIMDISELQKLMKEEK
jgi:hypothetical protein